MQAQPSLVEYGTRRTMIVIGVMAATLLQVLDATIVNVALPTIQGNLGATLDEGTWIITGYIIAAVIVIPLTPWLQMRFGRTQYYVAAIIGFTLTSALCGISTSLWELVFFRVLQGFCGGGLIATGQAILRDTFPPEQIGRSQALISLGAVVGPSIGPTLGGILTDAYSWNWIFYINILPGILAAVMIATTLRNPSTPRKAPVDGVGLSLLALGLGALQYVLNEGERNDWFSDDKIVALSITSVVALAGFIWWELFGARSPIVDLRILRNRTVAAGCVLALTLGFSLFGGIVLAPQFNQSILGFTATLSGESILIRALAILAGTPLTLFMLGRLKVNPRYLLASGFLLVVASYVLQAQVTTSTADFWTFWFPLALGGFGFSQLFVPLLVTVLSSVHGLDTAKASALVSLSQQLGGSISTAAVVTSLAQRDALHYSSLAQGVTLRNPAVAGLVQHGASLGSLYGIVVQQAQTLAYADTFLMIGFITLCLTPCVLLLRSQRATVAIQLPAE
jgi:DHA2 family multidrug resistance protein